MQGPIFIKGNNMNKIMEYRVVVNSLTGTTSWFYKGKLHREDGPAWECSNGTKAWYKKGMLHRDDGPAYIDIDGSKFWFINDKRHRIDGPAVEYANGKKAWYIAGKNITKEEFDKATKKPQDCSDKIVEIDGVKYQLKAI